MTDASEPSKSENAEISEGVQSDANTTAAKEPNGARKSKSRPSKKRDSVKRQVKSPDKGARIHQRVRKPQEQAASDNGGKDTAKFPRHSVDKALRIPLAIIEQNAGRETTDRDSAKFVGVGFNGPYSVEISSSIKYGFLNRPGRGHISVTDRARQALRPQNPGDEIIALREAILEAPDISAVYKHYRGENLPDRKFFDNTLVDTYNIPSSKVAEFTEVFTSSLKAAHLIEQVGEKQRIIDVTTESDLKNNISKTPRQVSKLSKIDASADSCFVVMPFSSPIGTYYTKIYEPAIIKAGLRPIRADAEIFGTGKIIDQIWRGINTAKVLIAELTSRNANVFYELGLAHALDKPVVLISSNENDVPFDLKHIRVIYYDV